MTFLSYSQNLEDVLLWRALRHVERGFYVDIGAAWPVEDSVTKAFYERGWRGVNVEPNPAFHALLAQDRPRDTNLAVAVGEAAGRLAMVFFRNTGLSTLHGEIAARHAEAGWIPESRDVEVTTLASIWQGHVPSGQDVHFLKVDVEGHEEAVLRGQDWSRNRPWIVVVEATLPLSRDESFRSWEPHLLGSGYVFAWDDGLNRYYLSEERAASLLPAFRHPPNCFDDFIPAGQRRAEEEAARVRSRLAALERDIEAAVARAVAAECRAAEAEERFAEASDHSARESRLAAEAVERLMVADLRARESVALAESSAAHAADAEERAAVAAARAATAEDRAVRAEERTREAWTRMADAEARARDAEARAAEAGARTREAEERAAGAALALARIERSLTRRVTRSLRALLRPGT